MHSHVCYMATHLGHCVCQGGGGGGSTYRLRAEPAAADTERQLLPSLVQQADTQSCDPVPAMVSLVSSAAGLVAVVP
jgi:hypothetical protein